MAHPSFSAFRLAHSTRSGVALAQNRGTPVRRLFPYTLEGELADRRRPRIVDEAARFVLRFNEASRFVYKPRSPKEGRSETSVFPRRWRFIMHHVAALLVAFGLLGADAPTA